MSKTNNILILDPGSYKKNTLQDMLVKNGFNVYVSTSEGDATAALENFKPDIILCRVSSKMIKDDRLLCGFHDAVTDKNIPFVVVSTGVDVDYYLKILERGISHSIMPPFSIEFLVSRINEIINQEMIAADDDPLSINFSYRGTGHSLCIKPAQLAQFIISLLHNSVNHSLALSAVMQKKNLLQQRLCRPDLFDGIRTKTETELQVEMDLYRGLERGEFVLHYQPIMSLAENRITGFEALVRWNHPERGLVAPGDFIPVAERLPFILPLGFWIIEEAVKQLGSWQETLVISLPIHMGINLSANQFINPGLGDGIAAIIRNSKVDPANIAFEITESAFMTDMESANIQLLKLKSDRHAISMDDFGTGYSSLSYLQHFPVDTLKIDQSFVRWMHVDDQSMHIVRAVVGLAHNLGMNVVAEGVEEMEHLAILKDLACDYGQGYYFSKPLDADAAEDYLKNFFARRKS